jgi:hypothetical protein
MIEGIDEFRDFAESIDDIDVDIAIHRGVKKSGEDYIDEVTARIKAAETDKGGTFDSRTSPYEPGGTNESSTDSYHISENDAWNSRADGQKKVIVKPVPEVAKRAEYMEYGTSDHGPDGETPMYFYVDGVMIVVTEDFDKSELDASERIGADDIQDAAFTFGTPGTVDGVDEQKFFANAAHALDDNNVVVDNIEQELEREFEEAFA